MSNNLIVWKKNPNNITDLPFLTKDEIYESIKLNLIYKNDVTLLANLNMSDSGNYIEDILKSISFEGM